MPLSGLPLVAVQAGVWDDAGSKWDAAVWGP